MGNIIDLEEQRNKKIIQKNEVPIIINKDYLISLVDLILRGDITDIYGVVVLQNNKYYALAPENFTKFTEFKTKMNEVIENLERHQ